MSAKQQMTLALGIAVFGLMVIVPPWARVWTFANNPEHSAPTAYTFIWKPPQKPQPKDFGLSDDYNVVLHTTVVIDWSRLIAQWLVVLAVTIGGMVWFAEPKSLSSSLRGGPSFDLDEEDVGGGKPSFDLDDEGGGPARVKPPVGKKRIKLPPLPPSGGGPEPMVTEDDL